MAIGIPAGLQHLQHPHIGYMPSTYLLCPSYIVYHVGLWYQAPFLPSTCAYSTSMVTLYHRFLVLAHTLPTAIQAVPTCLWYPILWFLATGWHIQHLQLHEPIYHCRCYHLHTLQAKLLTASTMDQIRPTNLWYLALLCCSMATQDHGQWYQS